jgi:hypothetical protein
VTKRGRARGRARGRWDRSPFVITSIPTSLGLAAFLKAQADRPEVGPLAKRGRWLAKRGRWPHPVLNLLARQNVCHADWQDVRLQPKSSVGARLGAGHRSE